MQHLIRIYFQMYVTKDSLIIAYNAYNILRYISPSVGQNFEGNTTVHILQFNSVMSITQLPR